MPSLFSRRKSEANLRTSPSSGTIPSEPLPTSLFSKLVKGGGGGRPPPASKTNSGARSKSVGRDGAEGRPERERAAGPLGGKGGKAPAVTLDLGVGERNAEDDGGWGGLDGKNQLSATSSGAPTPIAARFASPSAAGRGYDTPPRRDSSFASTFPTVSSVSAAFTSPPANLVASPSFFPSSPPTSDGGHDGLSLDAPALSTFKPASSRREREQTPASNNGISQTSDSPNSSFASPGFSPAVARLDRLDQPSQRAGLPPSSSFYNFGAAVSPVQSPAKSPPHPPRRESLMARRNGNESFPIVESEEGEVSVQDSPSVSRTRRAASQGVEAENLARESTRRREQTSPPVSMRSASQSLSPSPSSAIALNALSSASSPDLSSSTARGAYNPLAAFFGTASTTSTPSFASPALSASSSFGTPALSANFSPSASDVEGGEASAATPVTSDGEEDSPLPTPADEKPFPPILQAKKPVLQPPIQLEPATRPRQSLQSSSATPTQADFPPPSTPSRAEKPPLPPASPPSLARSTPASTKQQYSPVVAVPPRRESLPPLSPLRAARRSGSTGQASLAKAAPSSTTSLEQRKTVVDAAERSTAAASETATSSSLKKLPPSPLDPASLAASQASPSRSRNDSSPTAALSSPRTPRTPSTATSTSLKSPRALPASFNLDLETSPKRRITTEGTPRTMALKAARERQRRKASEASEGSGGSGGKEVVSGVEPQKVVEDHSAVGVAEEELKREAEEQQEVEEEQEEEEVPLRPRVEYAFSLFAPALLHTLLHEISFIDLVSLRQVSRTIRRSIDEGEAKEVVLERFLGAQGYRRFAPGSASSPGKRRVVVPPSDTINLDIRDLLAFRAGLALPPDAYSLLARTYASSPPEHFSPTSLKLARATTRAWNRVVLRLRSQSLLPAETFAPAAFPALNPSPQPVYKTGRAASLRVWVPVSSTEEWMTDAEVVECEREIWRAGNGAWAQLRKGDIVTNVACEAFGNVGKLVFDGRYLRDLAFSFDVVGHLPPWLNMLAFSPSYYHNIVVSSSSDPVFYLSLAPFVDSVRETIQLCSDRVGLSSPQGCYVVKRFVWRAGIKIKSGQLIGSTAGVGGSGPGGIDVVHDEWVGQLVLEADGTTEQATMLVARAASVEPTPWRIVRSKCRPGRLFLRPVLDSEAC